MQKLMVVVGAGASIELGMPSVWAVDQLFATWALDWYPLEDVEGESLYSYIRNEINNYYTEENETNFEEVLHVLYQLAALHGDSNNNKALNPFITLDSLPTVRPLRKPAQQATGYDLGNMAKMLVDKLLGHFRQLCIEAQSEKPNQFRSFFNFLNQLTTDFEVAFVSLNYDNLITQACPNLYTGFDRDSGEFDFPSVVRKTDFNLIYHLHGSVHFDMPGTASDMHRIKWNVDLSSSFNTNSHGRNSQSNNEGVDLPTSTIVAGLLKTNQLLRPPFRTFYAKIDEIATSADAYLFLGYGFNDLHLNATFDLLQNGETKKPVVIVDYSDLSKGPVNLRHDLWTYNASKTLKFSQLNLGCRNHNSPADMSELRTNLEFEVHKDPNYHLVIWHHGFITACENYQKIKAELMWMY